MIRLDAATVLLQWSTGGLAFLWVTTRRRTVGLGYGWLLRGTYALLAIVAVAVGVIVDPVVPRELASAATALAALVALGVSIDRKAAGVRGQRAEHDRRSARVAAMTGIDRAERAGRAERAEREVFPDAPDTAEFDPRLDLVAPILGALGLIAASADTGGPVLLAAARTLVGAAFLGAITDAMLLGHWYLVQPGLARSLLNELVRWVAWVWPAEVVVMLMPTGMVSVFTGAVDDGWNGVLGWMWAACAITTIVLVFTTRKALEERAYSAVMAATGLLYLAILTAFGTDLVARAVLAA